MVAHRVTATVQAARSLDRAQEQYQRRHDDPVGQAHSERENRHPLVLTMQAHRFGVQARSVLMRPHPLVQRWRAQALNSLVYR
jgi:hypothetical protein